MDADGSCHGLPNIMVMSIHESLSPQKNLQRKIKKMDDMHGLSQLQLPNNNGDDYTMLVHPNVIHQNSWRLGDKMRHGAVL